MIRQMILAAWLCATVMPLAALDVRNRSTSSTGQFTIYCDDRETRGRVTSVVEETKTEVLRIFEEADAWSIPIVITIDGSPEAQAGKPTVLLKLTSAVGIPKIDLAVHIGDDPARIHLQKQIVRAVLLEMIYRDASLKPAGRFEEAPWWMVEGVIQILRRRDSGPDASLYKSIVSSSKIPPLEKFLTTQPTLLDGPAGAVDSACAMCLMEVLRDQVDGAANLGRFLRAWPKSEGDAIGLLHKYFPSLGISQQSLTKWWVLQLARFSAINRWEGLPIGDTEEELAKALMVEVTIDTKGQRESFKLADFEKFVKLPRAKPSLLQAQAHLVLLGARANPLYRSIIAEYSEICGRLANGRSKAMKSRISAVEQYQLSLKRRLERITDYMNWYEATQTPGSTGVFDRYLQAVELHNAASNAPTALPPLDPRISNYLDTLESEFEAPNPGQPAGTF